MKLLMKKLYGMVFFAHDSGFIPGISDRFLIVFFQPGLLFLSAYFHPELLVTFIMFLLEISDHFLLLFFSAGDSGSFSNVYDHFSDFLKPGILVIFECL